MATGLQKLIEEVGDPTKILEFLDCSAYDELIEIDTNSRTFHCLTDVSKKYPLPLANGSYEELYINMVELLVHPEDKERAKEALKLENLPLLFRNSFVKGFWCGELRFRLLSGNWHWVEPVMVTGKPFGLSDGVYRMYLYDIHSRKARELGLSDEPLFIDEPRNDITGLPGKRMFTKAVTALLKNSLIRWCIVSLDIENFKLFNEWYGHNRGDLLMSQIGVRLRMCCEELGGTAGYFGQDDFCVLMPYDMEKIEKLYSDIAAMVSEHGTAIGITPAFGVCIVDEDVKLRDMIDRAFLATRFAKESYHSRIRIFDKAMVTKTDEEYHILSDFFRAKKENEITFYLQPQCRASTGKIVGAEALARWKKKDGSLISPAQFIPVLEKHGLITDLDVHIWESVCKWLRSCIDRKEQPLPVSVNVSAIDILNLDLTEVLDNLLKKYELTHDLLKVEITESAYISNNALVKSTVQSLRDKGFVVLMDDFGSGYSTLNMLKNLNIDIVKLDAQLIDIDPGTPEKSIQILESVTNMTKTLGIPIIVEGVESQEQKDFLQDIGCSYIQGYYFYRPMPTDDFEALLFDKDKVDTSGILFKANQQFHLSELLNDSVYSDNMLNNILGACALYTLEGDSVDIIRFNEQFYEAVNVPDFHQRLDGIEKYMPEADYPAILKVLRQAEKDRLNGAKGLFHFYKTDGTLTSFYIRFFYLRSEGEKKTFFGAAQNITKQATLETQMFLLSRCSPDTVIFLRHKPDNNVESTVLFNGLEKQLGLTREELEKELNSVMFYRRIKFADRSELYRNLLDKISHSESFSTTMEVDGANGSPLSLHVYGDSVRDETGTIDYIVTLRNSTEANKI